MVINRGFYNYWKNTRSSFSKKIIPGTNAISYNLINISNGKELWIIQNDLMQDLENQESSPIILDNNLVLIVTKSNTSCYQIATGKRIWANELLKNFYYTKQIDSQTIIGSIDKDRKDKFVESVIISLKTGQIVTSNLYQLKNINSSEYNNTVLYGINKQRSIFLVNDFLECYDHKTKRFLWQREVTPPYLTRLAYVENNVIFPATMFYECCANYDLTTKIISVNMNTGKVAWDRICSYNFDLSDTVIYSLRKQCTDDGYPEFVKLDGKSGKIVETFKPARIRKMDARLLLMKQIIACPISTNETGDYKVVRWDILNKNLELIFQINMKAKQLKNGTIIIIGDDFFLLRYRNAEGRKDIVSYYKITALKNQK